MYTCIYKKYIVIDAHRHPRGIPKRPWFSPMVCAGKSLTACVWAAATARAAACGEQNCAKAKPRAGKSSRVSSSPNSSSAARSPAASASPRMPAYVGMRLERHA